MLRLRRPSPATGIALLALFIALGGTSYATVAAVAPNTVGTQQIKNDSVTRAKIAHESVTSVLVKDGSLMATDFAANQIPAGPAGPAGAKGDKGDKGDTGATGAFGPIRVRTATVAIGDGNATSLEVKCASNEHATGAGTSWSSSLNGLSTVSLTPVADSKGVTSFVARGENQTGAKQAYEFTAYVLCYVG